MRHPALRGAGTSLGQPAGRSPATEDGSATAALCGAPVLTAAPGSPSGGAWIQDAYTGTQLTRLSELRLQTLVSRGQQMLATMMPSGPSALQQKYPSGQQVSVP